MYRIKGQASQWRRDRSSRCFVKQFAKSSASSMLPVSERDAKTPVKITGPFLPSLPFPPPRPALSGSPSSHPTTRTSPSSRPPPPARCGARPRVSVCGQCTLLHEPRPFTEGPRNAIALNNHPPEDRRPCARRKWQENKPGIRIRWIARREKRGRWPRHNADGRQASFEKKGSLRERGEGRGRLDRRREGK